MSSFVWIDHSEKQRRQVLDAVDQFREKDTRDELGIASIRDAISDTFFPGTGALQTRARYFFFIPWMFRQLEAKRSSADLLRRVRDFEVRLIDTLADSEGKNGTIGINARKALQRFPSSIYWNGMRVLGILAAPGSLGEYYRAASRPAAGAAELIDDDGERVSKAASRWHPRIPPTPPAFPTEARFGLTVPEAQFLKDQIVARYPTSLFTFFLGSDLGDERYEFAWDHPATEKAPADLRRHVDLARMFSEVMNGAAIMYNLAVAELEPKRSQIVEECSVLLQEWRETLDARQDALKTFETPEFWKFIHECGWVGPGTTVDFVDEWFSIALRPERRQALSADARARELIFDRERRMKTALARCDNRSVREMWKGDAGLGRLAYRWPNAEVLLHDIIQGLKRDA